MERRRFLTTTCVFVAGSLAGCSEDTESSDDVGGSDGGDNSTPADGQNQDTESGSGSTKTDQNTETEIETQTNQTVSVPIGEVVEDDQLSMVVREVTTQRSIGEFQEADQGNTFAIVRLAVKNTTESEFIGFSGFLQTQIKDSENYTYEQVIAATGQTFQGGQLAPGEVSRGDLVYEIPQDSSGLTLQFDFQAFSFFNFERVNVNLEETASTVGDLSQDLRIDVHSTGDEVSSGNISVTVNNIEYRESIGSFTEAEEGNEFAIVDITTTNNTSEEQRLSTSLQMRMKDERGNSYPVSLTAISSLDQGYNEGQPLSSGESRRGKVPYEVPQGVSPLYWVFEFNLWVNANKTFWEVR